MTCKVVRHMKLFIAKGTLIVPVWKLAHFWPLALMEFTGVTLFMTGLFCPISLIYLLHAKLKIPFSIFGAFIVCLHATGLFVNYRLDDALDGFNVYTIGGFILVPLMGRIKDLKI